MEWLNYHHLYYFSVIAHEGGIAAAARQLRLTHSTLSTQLRLLEEQFGAALFERRGKRLVLTPFGVEASSYAADIFRLGRELNDVARGRGRAGRNVLRIGVVPGIPKTLAHHLLAPALDAVDTGATFVRQDTAADLIELLATGRIHVVLTNDLPSTAAGGNIHAHALGETEILIYGARRLATIARRKFPSALDKVPWVLPPNESSLRRRLDEWFSAHALHPTIKAEIDDAGLLRAFGSAGRGVIPVRATLKAEVEDLHGLELIGRCAGVREHYYALMSERRIKHPALAALVSHARANLQTRPVRSRKGP